MKDALLDNIVKRLERPSSKYPLGEYVFACKYPDADPEDRWRIDIIETVSLGSVTDKPYVYFKETGAIPFYYVAKITGDEGRELIKLLNNKFNQ